MGCLKRISIAPYGCLLVQDGRIHLWYRWLSYTSRSEQEVKDHVGAKGFLFGQSTYTAFFGSCSWNLAPRYHGFPDDHPPWTRKKKQLNNKKEKESNLQMVWFGWNTLSFFETALGTGWGPENRCVEHAEGSVLNRGLWAANNVCLVRFRGWNWETIYEGDAGANWDSATQTSASK